MARGEALHKSAEQFPQESSRGEVFSYALSITHELFELAGEGVENFEVHLPAPEVLSEIELEKIAESFREKGWDANIAPLDAAAKSAALGVCVMSISPELRSL